MSVLIEGLPDAVAIRCLARVPFYLFPKLETICQSWRDAVQSTEFYKAREEVKSTENLLCVCAFDPENVWQLYDPNRDIWITLPILPSKVKNLAHFGVVSTGGKLFVLGGCSDAVDPSTGDQDDKATNEVWAYDPILRQWAPRAPMIVPRVMFACCVLDGKILVAGGGFTTRRKKISKAEIYDPEKDIWVSIPDLQHTHDSPCCGLVIHGEVHIVYKGLNKVQVLTSIKDGWNVYEHSWVQGMMTVVNGSLYVMLHGLIFKQESSSGSRKIVGTASEFKKRIGFAMVGLQDDIYVIGGVIGPEGWNWDIKKMSDVYVLSLGNERPVWQKAASMTLCRGTIFGCAELRI